MSTKILVRPTEYEITREGGAGGIFLKVSWRSEGKWAVTTFGQVLNSSGEWEYEPQPSNRTDEFIKRTRFDLKTAVKLGTVAFEALAGEYDRRMEARRKERD